MKNYKYIKMTQEYVEEDALIELLVTQAKSGWMIKKIDYSYITFEECEPQTLKFQVDYVAITNEYKNIMIELGYAYACSLNGMNIFYNEDLDARDLYNDEKTRILSQLNYFKTSKISSGIFWILICATQIFLLWNSMLFSFYRHSVALFYARTNEYLLIGTLFLYIVIHSIDAIYVYCMRRHYKKLLNEESDAKVSIKYLKIYSYIQKVNIWFLAFMLPVIVTSVFMERYDLFRLSVIAGLSLSLIYVVVMLFGRHKFKNMIYAIGIVLSLGIGIGLYFSTNVNVPVDKLYYETKVKDIYVDVADDLLSSYRMIHVFHDEYYERCVVSVNEVFSKEIFKEELITLDAYARNAVAKSDYLKYEEVINNMNVLEDERIDEGYYNYDYVVFKKDNMVVSFRRSDVPMEDVIDYYLSK